MPAKEVIAGMARSYKIQIITIEAPMSRRPRINLAGLRTVPN